jgi:hypothetical protein
MQLYLKIFIDKKKVLPMYIKRKNKEQAAGLALGKERPD